MKLEHRILGVISKNTWKSATQIMSELDEMATDVDAFVKLTSVARVLRKLAADAKIDSALCNRTQMYRRWE